MGSIDPMAISNAVVSGGMDFTGWPVAWLILVGLLVGAAAAIAFANAELRTPPTRVRPRLPQVPAAGALAGRPR